MIEVHFVSADGATEKVITAPPGTRLLDLAQANGQPLEGTCEGAMACSTCHVLITGDDANAVVFPVGWRLVVVMLVRV
jgi:ferredoxin